MIKTDVTEEEKKKKKEEELTSNSLLRLIVLSLSVSAVEDWVETLCGAYDGVDDGGAMLDVGVSGLEGGFKKNSKYQNIIWILYLRKLKAKPIDLQWKTLVYFATLIDENN